MPTSSRASSGHARLADRDILLADLDAARDAFHDALADVDLELATVPGVMGDWSVRDLVFHVAAWCDHGSAALDLASSGRGDDFAYSWNDTDAMNEQFLADGRSLSPTAALRREDEAFGSFRQRLADLDPVLLDLRLGNGDTVAQVIVYDGPRHYAEHTEHVRAWFGEEAAEAEEP
jgi:Mycothiol maleylpyruvate isomerase N-terminal domain